MSLTIQPVETAFFHQTWPLVEGFIDSAMKWGDGDYTMDQVKALLAKGNWLLLVAVDEDKTIHGAATVEFNNMPNARVAFITAIGGKLISSKDTYAQMCAILKNFGATTIQGAARKSVARLWHRYGFEERYIIVEAQL